jgi:hypothetical protein
MKPPLTTHQQSIHDAIFRHPIARDLDRRDVNGMLGALADVTEEHNGNLKVTRNGQTLVLHVSQDKNISTMEELMQIRHFLEHSDHTAAAALADGHHILVVIDHREARIYRAELHGAVPQRITPFDPHGFGRNLHYVQDESNGQRKPERKSFYEAIAKTLRGATQILLFGSGTGAASAMEQLLGDLRKNHPDVAQRVVGSITLDAQHLTEDQLLARAREFYKSQVPSSGRE